MSLADLISADVALTKRGKDYWGRCPWHEDKTPSFSVSCEKELYYCFSCHKGGDAIQFLRDYRGLSFPEACRVVGKDCAAPSRPPDPQLTRVAEIERQIDILLEEWAILQVEKASMWQFPEEWALPEKLDHYCKEAKLLTLHVRLLTLLDRFFPEVRDVSRTN